MSSDEAKPQPQEPEVIPPSNDGDNLDRRMQRLEETLFDQKVGLVVKLNKIDTWCGQADQVFKQLLGQMQKPQAQPQQQAQQVQQQGVTQQQPQGGSDFQNAMQLVSTAGQFLGMRGQTASPLDRIKEEIFLKTLTNSMNLTDTLTQAAIQNLLGGAGKSQAKQISGMLKS